jgi:cytochrome c biogenesis DsbD-like protein
MLFMRVFLIALVFAQTLLPKPTTLQHIAVEPSTSAATVEKGGVVTLWADVTPKPNIHVYASNKQGFTPVTLAIGAQPRITIGKTTYPNPELAITPGTDALIPMYSKSFRLAQTITIAPSAKSGDVLTIAGAINYQACNETLCFPVTSLPVTWALKVK